MVINKSEYDIERTMDNMKKLRLGAGMRQVDVAQAMGVPRTYVSKWESGTRPSFNHLVMLYRILHGLPVADGGE